MCWMEEVREKRGIEDNAKVLILNNWRLPLAEMVKREKGVPFKERHILSPQAACYTS